MGFSLCPLGASEGHSPDLAHRYPPPSSPFPIPAAAPAHSRPPRPPSLSKHLICNPSFTRQILGYGYVANIYKTKHFGERKNATIVRADGTLMRLS
jgi:hypothetical protein